MGVKTVMPATPTDAYGLLLSAIRDDDPVVFFGPLDCMGDPGRCRLRRPRTDPARPRRGCTGPAATSPWSALGHLVHDAIAVADELAGEVSVEVFDPRTVYPFDWAALAESVGRTGRLVVFDDSQPVQPAWAPRCWPPRPRSSPCSRRRNGSAGQEAAMVGASPELDIGLLPTRDQLRQAIHEVLKSG